MDGNAHIGMDFSEAAIGATIPAGGTSTTVSVTVLDDGVGEPAESFLIAPLSITEVELGVPSVAVVQIGGGTFIRDEAFAVTMGGCVPVLVADETAIRGPGAMQVEISVDSQSSGWQSEGTLNISSGEAFQMDLPDLPYGGRIYVDVYPAGGGDALAYTELPLTFEIPPSFNTDEIDTSWSDPVLYVTVPRTAFIDHLSGIALRVWNRTADTYRGSEAGATRAR